MFFKSRRGARQIRVAQTHYDLSLRRFIDETAPRLETLKLPPVPHITSPARLGPATLDGALPVQNTGYTAIGRDDDICGFQLWLIKVEGSSNLKGIEAFLAVSSAGECSFHTLNMDQEDAPLLSSQPSTATQVQDRRKPNAILDIWLGFSPYFKYCIGLKLLCELAMMIITVPMVSILEHSLCVHHYHGEIPAADACKIPPIQQSLAEVRGGTASFETIAFMAH